MALVVASLKESRHLPQMCLSHSRIPEAKQSSLIGSTFTPSPLLKLGCFQEPIPNTFESVGAHGMMSIFWLQWREPAHDLCIFVGVIDVSVETIFYVAGIGIAVAKGDCICMCGLGHDTRFKTSVVCRNKKYVALMGEFTKLFCRQR